MTKILIGNSGSPTPYSYTTDDDELTGYEIEGRREKFRPKTSQLH